MLIIQTGTPLVANANSYATEAELDAYLLLRGYTVTADKEPLLVRSYDFMSGLNWNVDHSEAYEVLESHKSAQCEIAYRFSLGLDSAATPTASVKRKKVDVLETEYFSNTSRSTPSSFLNSMPQAASFLKGLVSGSSGYLERA